MEAANNNALRAQFDAAVGGAGDAGGGGGGGGGARPPFMNLAEEPVGGADAQAPREGAPESLQDAVSSAVAALGDRVTREQCRELSRRLKWSGNVEEFIDVVFDEDEETISKTKVLKKALAERLMEDRKKHEKDILREKGEATFSATLKKPGVDGLSALPPELRDGVVPCDTDEVRLLCARVCPASRARRHAVFVLVSCGWVACACRASQPRAMIEVCPSSSQSPP